MEIENKNEIKDDKNLNIKHARLLTMPQSNVLSEQDINHLFMGLLRLVKRSTEQQLKEDMKSKFNKVNQKLQIALEKQQGIYETLELENKDLKQKLSAYEIKIQKQTRLYNEKIKKLESLLKCSNVNKK